MASDCIFCRIAAGESPCSLVYEDDHTMAFLDISPVARGHTLVVPRKHVEQITAADDETLTAVMRTVRKVAAAEQRVLGADGINVTQANGEAAGQVVPHLHVHVIPRRAGDGAVRAWKQGAYDNTEEMARLAGELRAGIAP